MNDLILRLQLLITDTNTRHALALAECAGELENRQGVISRQAERIHDLEQQAIELTNLTRKDG